MRDERQVFDNMPAALGAFYRDRIPRVRAGIAEYLPESIDAAFFERLTGEQALYEQDYVAIYESTIAPTQEYLAASGKVLRPILAAIILEAYGSESEQLRQFLGAIEVMEDSSIMMDDYIDNSKLRRGIPCAHVAHGFSIANIASCTGFALSHYIFYRNVPGFDDNKARRLLDAVAREHVIMAYGQLEELYWTESNINDVNESQYFQQVIARCAFLSFRGPMHYAAIIADEQRYFVRPDYPFTQNFEKLYPGISSEYFKRMSKFVVPNCQRLQAAFRSANAAVMYTAFGSHREDGSDFPGWARKDNALSLRVMGKPMYPHKNDPSWQIDDSLAPKPTELIVAKSSSGTLNSTFDLELED